MKDKNNCMFGLSIVFERVLDMRMNAKVLNLYVNAFWVQEQ